MNIREKIVEVAMGFLNEEEKPGNMGFVNSTLEKLLKQKAIDWKQKEPWCACIAELIYLTAYSSEEINKSSVSYDLQTIMTKSATQTLENFKKNNLWKVNSVAIPGALAIWGTVKDKKPVYIGGTSIQQGHIGIVVDLEKDGFKCAEGNTNKDGSREGTTFLIKSRKYNFDTPNGLRLLGFVHPI